MTNKEWVHKDYCKLFICMPLSAQDLFLWIHKTTLKLTPVHVLFLVFASGLMKDSDLKKKPMTFVHEHLIIFFLFLAFV
jgi:hypothetical protein